MIFTCLNLYPLRIFFQYVIEFIIIKYYVIDILIKLFSVTPFNQTFNLLNFNFISLFGIEACYAEFYSVKDLYQHSPLMRKHILLRFL